MCLRKYLMDDSVESQQGKLYIQVLRMEQNEGRGIIVFPLPYISVS